MVDQARVRSGFDIEAMVGEKALGNVLATLVESGVIPTSLRLDTPPIDFRLRMPAELRRLYDLDDGVEAPDVSSLAFRTALLFDDPRGDVQVTVVFDYTDRSTGGGFPLVPFELFLKLTYTSTPAADGSLEQAGLAVSLQDFETPIMPELANHGITKEQVLGILRPRVEQQLDLAGLGAFKRVQDLAIVKHPADGDHPAAYGVYLNLRLKDGPQEDAFLATRGDVGQARNFLPAGAHTAFATRAGLYGAVARDAFERRAEKHPSGTFVHPLRKSPSNPDSKEIGSIHGVEVGPLPPIGNPPVPRTGLRIRVRGDLSAIDTLFDPDFTLTIDMTPFVDAKGQLRWKIDTDVGVDTLFEFLPFLLFTGLSIVFGPGGLIASGIIAGSLVLIDVAAGLIAASALSAKVETKADATLLDVMPDRLRLVRRRWDPFYETVHEVATLPQGVLINDRGIAVWGTAAVGRSIRPVDHVVIRDERTDRGGVPVALRYRIDDAAGFAEQFVALAPATDRRGFTPPTDPADPTLYELDVAQAVARIAEGRLQANIPYLATRIQVRDGQIAQILAISERERNELRGGLIRAFRIGAFDQVMAEQGDELRQQVLVEFAAEGVTPSDDEVAKALAAKVDAIVDDRQVSFEADTLPGQLVDAVDGALRFDLPPEHLIGLQRQKILSLSDLFVGGQLAGTDFQIVRFRNGPHQGLAYYRDRPRFGDSSADNLLSLPRYRG